ncbi:hypothetical protein C8J56DRAFT_908890, partial [Mycena floridula]
MRFSFIAMSLSFGLAIMATPTSEAQDNASIFVCQMKPTSNGTCDFDKCRDGGRSDCAKDANSCVRSGEWDPEKCKYCRCVKRERKTNVRWDERLKEAGAKKDKMR